MESTRLERWSDPPAGLHARQLLSIKDPRRRADAAHLALKEFERQRTWLVRARAEAIAEAYHQGIAYAHLGEQWEVSGERVRQMMFQSGDGRSGWHASHDRAGLVHAMRAPGKPVAACGQEPVTNRGADFTCTVYPSCSACRVIVEDDLDFRGDEATPRT